MYSVNALIDSKSLIHNIEIIRTKIGKSKIVAVVKANAYGHGLIKVANILNPHVDAFAVARLEEAILLRNGGIGKRIILLEGFTETCDLPLIINHDLDVAVHSFRIMDMIENHVLSSPIRCWLKLDTGMHRLGVSLDDAKTLYFRMKNCSSIRKPFGLISHLCTADDPNKNEYTKKQIQLFNKFHKLHPELETCLANSAGIISWNDAITDWVRPGIIMYGVSPYSDKTGKEIGLKPVMTLKSNIIEIRKVTKGDTVGYDNAFQATCDTTLGIIGIGYGDGYPRQVPNGTPVYINGRFVPTAGHVCMDMMFVDLGRNNKDKIGDEVILWGDVLPVERIAMMAGTIPYELITKITNRVGYIWK